MRIKNHAAILTPKITGEKQVKKPWGATSSVALTLVVYFVSQIAAGLLILLYPLAKGWNDIQTQSWFDSSVASRFLLIMFIEALVVAAVYGLLKLRRQDIRSIGIKKPHWVDAGYALAGFGIYFLCYVAVFIGVKVLFPSIDLEQKQQIGFSTYQTGFDLFLTFVSLVILPPIAEEVLVRGFLYTGLRTKLPLWPAAIMASTVFAVAHLQFGSGAPLLWAAAIDTFVLSIVLVRIRESRGSLAAPIMIHMIKNGFAFMLLFVVHAN